MATKKVLYFTAGKLPTGAELTAIDKLNALAVPAYSVGVRQNPINTDSGGGKEAADYVAGTVPAAYSAVPVINPDSPPSGLPATQAIVTSGTAITVPVTGTYATKITPTVANGVITGFVLS